MLLSILAPPQSFAAEKSLNNEIASYRRTHALPVFVPEPRLTLAARKVANKLAKSNPEAMTMLKSIFWEGTENWDTLLTERAELSGKLVLSDFTKNAIAAFKSK